MARDGGHERPARESHRQAADRSTSERGAKEGRERNTERSRESHGGGNREGKERTDRGERAARERADRDRATADRARSRENTGRQKERSATAEKSRDPARDPRADSRARERQAKEASARVQGHAKDKTSIAAFSRTEKKSGGRPEKAPSHEGTQKGKAGHATKEATRSQAKAIERALAKDLATAGKHELEKTMAGLVKDLGAKEVRMVGLPDGRIGVRFTEQGGTERTWMNEQARNEIARREMMSVTEFELGGGRGAIQAPAARPREPSRPTVSTQPKEPPKRERPVEPKAPTARPERDFGSSERSSVIPAARPNPHRAAGSPLYPPGYSPEATIRLGREKRAQFGSDLIGKYAWFAEQVNTDGPMDFKKWGMQYEDAGNYNYGLLGNALGIPESTLRAAAGGVQIWRAIVSVFKNVFDPRPKPRKFTYELGWGLPFLSPSHGDDPRDQLRIGEGIHDSQHHR